MLSPGRRWKSREGSQDRQAGLTLVEMLVAMSIFSVVLAIFGAGVASMSKSSVRVQGSIEAANEARRAFNLLDRQLRYASEVNAAAQVGEDWYLEFRTDAQAPGSVGDQCTQWRYDRSEARLETRAWTDAGGAFAPTTWRVSADHVRNDPTTQPPFTMLRTDGRLTRQQLRVDLHVGRSADTTTQLLSTFVARNTTGSSATNNGETVCGAAAHRP